MDVLARLAQCESFEWDEGNVVKVWQRHRVSPAECEQVFFNRPLVAAPDEKHSQQELRFYALGQSDGGRQLFVVFTVRKASIRVISARNMSRRERRRYGSHGREEDA
jgi:uncharacterized DUF497 family protein